MDSSRRGLTALQQALLDAFRGVEGAWITGGSALGGFHLHHRRSYDIDVFSAEASRLDELADRVRAWCGAHDARCESVQAWPGFQRLRITRGDEQTLVDLVHETAAQVVPVDQKPVVDGLRIDPLRELRANKLAALLGRGDVKDLVDLHALALAGQDPLDGLEDAARKDGGLDPATLAWVLASVPVDTSTLLLEEPLDESELRRFRDALVEALQRLAWPGA